MKSLAAKTAASIVGLYLFWLVITFFFDHEATAMAGIFGLLAALVFLVLGIILIIFKNTRDVGKGFLIAAAIIAVIGFGVCSIGYSVYK